MATGYEVQASRPGGRRGEEFEIAGLGVFKNGSARLVTPDEAAQFRAYNARTVVSEEEEGPNGEPIYVTEPGPTLLEAFSGTDWVEVTAVSMVKDAEGEWHLQEEAAPAKKSDGGDK
jgi:hypothetical protein